MPLPSLDWIFFDVGGVLLDDTEAERRRTALLLEICAAHDPSIRTEDILRARIIASGQIGSLETSVIETLLTDPRQRAAAVQETKERRHEIAYEQFSHPRPEALAVVAELSKKYRLGIMANQPEHTTRRLEEYGILRSFSHFVMSDGYALHKPDPRLFLEVFKETGALPTHSLMIDDNIERGLLPAQALGMRTVWYRRETETRTDHPPVDAVIRSLKELLELL